MIDLLALCAFNAAYADAIDSDALEQWPGFFTEDCHYRITHVENEREGLPAGIVYADSRAMLEDRIAALREANIYERQRYRHLLGMPLLLKAEGDGAEARTPFMVARIMATGQTELFATGSYHDRFVRQGDGQLRLRSRVAVCDSTVTDTLLALPL
ncbi:MULTISPECIES: aromatic-ring-hydroxylating dioxygenase subunit beta [unclassified Variovorax]|jgi:anthranilate 1,2-dioxygenase small subunit/terephthalate 1,2-dioxygenase oxygenase component beta subunit|uniref:aromatic-ring-hydroxylating dioxygenase subunit beta n=1 Tax=unclassified Variovorax TaxID=663243 RepID=UPI0008D0A3F6|nr:MULTISPECIES: aromatic-ring-hydroxylating dioxygenase subunit beta [unclassified Variovorax]SEK08781.1 terephthalate 1,2-dioxygenase, beta subunit [Variovorax sp. OK202]SFD58496.1 terephthalate 1,2-dioxygenase, beta subunit [Variovorax sp. OK212]